MAELVVRDVHVRLDGCPVLTGVDLTVPSGTLLGLLGPSGCGKTTLLRLVAGFLAADRGHVLLAGRELTGPGGHVPAHRRRIGIVPQEGALFPHLDVAANVGFGLSRRDPDRAVRVTELLELIGMPDLAHRMPAELSGGQQQRVALARALAPRPDLVLLDEPFSALDAGLRAGLREDVRRVLTAAGATAVLVTHDQQEALSTADLVAVMSAGRVLQVATPASLYRDPVSPFVARFVGDAVFLPARRDGDRAVTALGWLPLRGGETHAGGERAGQVMLRPEQLRLLPAGDGVAAEIVGRWFYGHDAVVELRLADGADAAGCEPVTSGSHRVLARCAGFVPPPGPVGVGVEGQALFFPQVLPARRAGAVGETASA